MAFCAKTSQSPLRQNLRNPKTRIPETSFYFKPKTHHFSSKNAQSVQVLNTQNTSSIATKNPNSRLNELCLNGSLEQALKYLDSMQELNICVDEDALVNLVRLCEWKRGYDEGLYLHSVVSKTMTHLSVRLGNAFLSMFVKFGDLGHAWYVFGKMCDRDLFSWNVLIGGYAKAGFFDEALSLYQRMFWVGGVKPDVVISASELLGDEKLGREVHGYVIKMGFSDDVSVCNPLIKMYLSFGNREEGEKVFSRMESKDVVSWTTMISCYEGSCKCIDKALEVFHQIPDKNVISWTSIILGLRLNNRSFEALIFFRQMMLNLKPNSVTLVSILSACARIGALMCGKEIHAHALRIGVAFDGYAEQGQGALAEEFFRKMIDSKKMPMKPDAAIWGALLNACRIHRWLELGELAAGHIFETDTRHVGYYVLLCNLYAASGKWDEVAKVRRLMREKGLTIDPGCSWVEVKGEVHAFLSGDNFHPQIKEINSVLEGFYEKMKAVGFAGSEYVSMDKSEASKAEIFCGHSEMLAVAFGLINTAPGMPIWVTKNLYTCQSCHNTVKFISKIVRRDIFVRDTEHFHHFKDGTCSCGDEGYWGRLD
ncbi:hypothetical protein CUMW_217220, partial [Citrus unshiu]